MGPFPGMHEAAECGTHVRLISTDGEDLTEAYSPQEPATEDDPDPFESPTKPETGEGPGPWFPAGFEQECDGCGGAIFQGDEIRADGSGGYECQANCGDEDPHPDESPVTDHRKWCTRCKLLGHYAADCTTAVLTGGVVSVPVSVPASPGVGMVSVPVVDLSEPAPATHTGRPAQHTSPYIAALAAEVGDVGTVADGACSAAGGYASHVFDWNPHVSASQCVACGEDNPSQPEPEGTSPHSYADAVAASGQYLSDDPPVTGPLADTAKDPFESPTVLAPETNVSGQPKARYEWHGKQNRGYLVKLPETGDFRRYKNGSVKGLARATTFNKAASDSNALSDWGKRNVLIGASKRPDLVAQAHGLTHEDNRDQLMKLVAELETTAGAKVSADVGTLIHELTERWDAGVLTIDDVPQAYKELIRLYQDKLNQYGLRPVPGLIERTTYIAEFGGVVGTLDRVYYHESSGQYVIGDVKTGKTLKYGMDEIETQEWIYAHGVNNAGVYDWNTDTWQPPRSYGDSIETGPWEVPEVSEEWGVVIHMPVQGDDAGKVMPVRADLQRGKRHAEVCHQVRVQRANKPKPEAWTGEEFGVSETLSRGLTYRTWTEEFANIKNREQAAFLWQEAYDAGVPPEEMERLKETADARLKELAAPVATVEQLREDAFRCVTDVAHAGRLWEAARNAGVEPMELNRLVGLAQQRLRELEVSG